MIENKSMLSEDEFKETLDQSVKIISKNKNVLCIILFGSYARGDYSLRHSDIDLYVLADCKKDLVFERELFRLVNGINKRIQVHLSFEYKNLLKEGSLLRYNVLKEGKKLFEKGKTICLKKDFDLEEVYYLRTNLLGLEPYQKTNLKRSMLGKYKNFVLDYSGNIIIIKKIFLDDFRTIAKKKKFTYDILFEFLYREKQEFDEF